MKYKILKGTDTFKKLKDLEVLMLDYDKQASTLSKELSGSEDGSWLGKGYSCIAGGLSGIRMKEKPEGWRVTTKNYPDFFTPKINKQNKEVLDRIDALPTLNYDDLNAIVGFDYQSSGMRWFNCPGVDWYDDYVLLNIDNACRFIPNGDMIEILESEYITLKSGKP